MYVIVWEFIVHAEQVGDFVAAYKADGTWAQLFARADGYASTELLSATDEGRDARFLTIDRWSAVEDFARFQAQFGSEYRTLDAQLEGLIVSERKLGIFITEA
jgi:heme-degrading monooxygenase HmoA